MESVLIEVSCVVAANAHNPSILNPDWLRLNGVLPDAGVSWELSGPIIVTPPLATVEYQSGVKLLLESSKLSITLPIGSTSIFENPLTIPKRLAANYVSALPHIPYSAVGNNFKRVIEIDRASQVLVDTFGGSGSWVGGLDSVNAKLVYSHDDGSVRNVEFSAARMERTSAGESPVGVDIIMIASNYHRPTEGKDATLLAIEQSEEDMTDFKSFVERFQGEIGG